MNHSEDTSYPAQLLWDVSWTFRGDKFVDLRTFGVAVAEYQKPDQGDVWRPEEIVLVAPRVWVSPDVHWHLTDEHPVTEFTADNGVSFTMGELLFKLHNVFVTDLQQMDHKYFEGLTLAERTAGGTPFYDLDLGS